MKIFISKEGRLVEQQDLSSLPKQGSVWIDLFSPTDQEKKAVESILEVQIPSKEEMQEIESSSRLYKENDALIMTINAVVKNENLHRIVNVTFLLKGNALVTLRYDELPSFTNFLKAVTSKPPFSVESAASLLLALLEAFIEKIADALENISVMIEMLSQKIFVEKPQKNRILSRTLITMGLEGEVNSKTRDSLSSISRMIGFLKFNLSKPEEKKLESRLETLLLDATDLKDQSTFLEHKINFNLDASLGLINIEQNNIIKIFSIVAVVLLPPTLIASIYGMNFKFIPELNWKFGYPVALLVMILSAVLPYLYFKRKGWL